VIISDDVKSIMEYWRPKAIERYRRLFTEGNCKDSILYYDTMIDMPYDEAKEKFFADVGKGK